MSEKQRLRRAETERDDEAQQSAPKCGRRYQFGDIGGCTGWRLPDGLCNRCGRIVGG